MRSPILGLPELTHYELIGALKELEGEHCVSLIFVMIIVASWSS